VRQKNCVYKTLHAENFKIKKPIAKAKIWNLINHSTVCCQIYLGTSLFENNQDKRQREEGQ
jgi:hypothetical protein